MTVIKQPNHVYNDLGHSVYNYTGHATIGCLYDPARSRKDIAAEVRRQLAIYYPTKAGYKFSVTCSSGRGIDIKILKVPYKIVNPKHNPRAFKPYDINREPRYMPEAIELVRQVESILAAYNYSDCDGMTDYFNVNFYGSVQYDYAIENKEYTDNKVRTQEPVII